MTHAEIATARRIAKAADQGGTITPEKMVKLFPGEPTRHTHATVRQAWRWALPGIDADEIAEALWG